MSFKNGLFHSISVDKVKHVINSVNVDTVPTIINAIAGRNDYSVLSGLAAQYLIEKFAEIFNSGINAAIKLPKGKKKFQVKNETQFVQ